jgi:uncharacterized protein (TIGR03663 family)
MATAEIAGSERRSIGDRLLEVGLRVDLEIIAYGFLIAATIFSRFLDLGTRVMSHDESLHTYFSWKLADEGSFQHSPLMHGPLQFHLIALSYFLFGVSDTTARLPAAIASILAVAMMWLFRRYLGRWGAYAAAVMMAISPYMLYYGRYVRNEALVVPLALLSVYAVFRYFEDRRPRWLFLLAAGLALHFTAKETAFIYTAQLMLFLGLLLSWRLLSSSWDRSRMRSLFAVCLALVILGVLVAGAGVYADSQLAPALEGATVQPVDPTTDVPELEIGLHPATTAGILLAFVAGIVATAAAVASFRGRLRHEFPALDVLLIAATFTLPQLAAFPANMLGRDPLAYEDPASRLFTGIILGLLLGVAAAIGLAWNWRRWLTAAGIFFGIFTFFYTTVLTHPDGLFTGLVGSLGYWLEQHGVNRGSQPLYYYILVQVPVYEFLPAIGALAAGAFGLRSLFRQRAETESAPSRPNGFPVLPFLGWWAAAATVAFTVAGERMPWLTVHLTLPYILLAGWSIGRILSGVDWRKVIEDRGWAIIALSALALLALSQLIGRILGSTPPFLGAELDQLRRTIAFIVTAAVAIASIAGIVVLARRWRWSELARLAAVSFFGLLFVLTARASTRAAFVNYDQATEYLVYAHSAAGVKTVLAQVEELSRRTTDGMGIDVGYDDDVSWPFSWYMRDFTNSHYYAASPSRDLLNYPVVIAGDNNWAQVEPILGDRYYTFEYIRMWWPMQDYFNLTWDRIWGAVTSPEYRAALWDIWFNRDYAAYGNLTGTNFALEKWSPSDRMKLYIRKDMVALIWDYGVSAQTLDVASIIDPYAELTINLSAEDVISGVDPSGVPLQAPRGAAVGLDGSLFVADTGNHRIVKMDPAGEILGVWGSFGTESDPGQIPQFNEPWGLDVAADGSIYVADTWNHRVQHLSAEGAVIGSFGVYGEGQALDAFWGPRDVAIDESGRLFVADPGNKRVVLFSPDGIPIGSFGGVGVGLGQLDEPVGVAIGPQGRVYVADTWNQRVQGFEEFQPGVFEPVTTWPIEGWFGQSLDNKPYLTVADSGEICLSDPEAFRVICFNEGGDPLFAWGDAGEGPADFGQPVGLAYSNGTLWVVDKGNNRLMSFVPPFPGEE